MYETNVCDRFCLFKVVLDWLFHTQTEPQMLLNKIRKQHSLSSHLHLSHCVCVCVALLNRHRNTRFTAPACQDSLWPQASRRHLVHPVDKKTELRSALTEGETLIKT